MVPEQPRALDRQSPGIMGASNVAKMGRVPEKTAGKGKRRKVPDFATAPPRNLREQGFHRVPFRCRGPFAAQRRRGECHLDAMGVVFCRDRGITARDVAAFGVKPLEGGIALNDRGLPYRGIEIHRGLFATPQPCRNLINALHLPSAQGRTEDEQSGQSGDVVRNECSAVFNEPQTPNEFGEFSLDCPLRERRGVPRRWRIQVLWIG